MGDGPADRVDDDVRDQDWAEEDKAENGHAEVVKAHGAGTSKTWTT